MHHIHGSDREHAALFPEPLDDSIAGYNSVRFLDAFVDNAQSGAQGLQARRASGYPPTTVPPADLLKLHVYGYLSRILSSGQLEKEARRNLELMWSVKRLTPDFGTIADFHRDNRQAIRRVSREFTLF